MTLSPRRVARLVASFREGRQIPPDLFGGGSDDRALAGITDGLDKLFAILGSVEYRDEFAAGPRDPMWDLVVSERQVLCDDEDVVQLTFRRADGGQLPPWNPGAHLDLRLPSGRRRQYSLCGERHDRSLYRVAVRRMPEAGGSHEMHAMEVGTKVPSRSPREGFPFVGGGSALFIAGGIGITPIIAMVREAQELGMDWFLVYAGRSRASLPFLAEIEGWDPERVVIRTDDEHGIPHAEDLLRQAPEGGAVYCCGPGPMIDGVRRGFEATAATELHFERFGAAPVVDGVEFEVELAQSGRVLTIPATRTILEAIRGELPGVAYSCQQGFCGTCRTRVLGGTPDHREDRLTAEEKRTEMLICVSRAAGGRLILDL